MRPLGTLFFAILLFPLFSQAAACPNLTRNLSLGSRGTDVIQLQRFLMSQNLLQADSATGYFGKLTQAAVKQFQCKNNIVCNGSPASTGWGNVGAKTRAAIVRQCATDPNSGRSSPPDTTPYTRPAIPSDISNTPQPISCVLFPPQTQTLSCPAGQTGSITQTRTSSCAIGATSPTWGEWQTGANTCHTPICTTNYQQLTWSSPRNSGGFRAPVLLTNGNMLAARTVINGDGSYSVQTWRSQDSGASWTFLSEMARLNDTNDLGDGTFVQLSNGDILYAVRHHYYTCNSWACSNPGNSPTQNIFRIEVLKSPDSGATWRYHSTVAVSSGTAWGYWSPFLIQLSNGALQVYYDDEVTPAQQGLLAHQWAMMKTWDPASGTWINPVTVSRALDTDLSRDGMVSVAEVNSGRLVASLESVDTAGEHKGVVRTVSSNDYGATWSWQSSRPIAYQPTDHSFNALSPWLVRLKDDSLALFFTTDEDRAQPGTPAQGEKTLDLSVKYRISTDNGATWLAPTSISNTHPLLFPGALTFSDGKVFVQYSANNNYWYVVGTPIVSCTP